MISDGGLNNIHTYFRKEITIDQSPVRAVLYITGDDTFKFYINGRFFVQGPEPGYPFAHPYYVLPVTVVVVTVVVVVVVVVVAI